MAARFSSSEMPFGRPSAALLGVHYATVSVGLNQMEQEMYDGKT